MYNAEKSYNGHRAMMAEIEKDIQKVIEFNKNPIVAISYMH